MSIVRELTANIPKETCPLIDQFQADAKYLLPRLDKEAEDYSDVEYLIRDAISVTEELRDANYTLRKKLEEAINRLDEIQGILN